MNHYLFKYSIIKCRDLFLGRRVSSIGVHSKNLFSMGFKNSNWFLFVDLSPQNSFLMPFNVCLERSEGQGSHFFDFLRRRLIGLKLSDVRQKYSERVAYFTFDDVRGSIINRFRLIFEIMGRNANAIFTLEDNTIVQAYKYVELARIIEPKKKYEPPFIDMPDILKDGTDELLLKFRHKENILGFDGRLRSLVRSEEEFLELVKTIRKIFANGDIRLYLYPKSSVYPFKFKKVIREVDDNFLFDKFILRPRQKNFESMKNNLERILKRKLDSLRRRLAKVENELKVSEDCDRYRIFAENLMANPNLDVNYRDEIEITNVYTGDVIKVPLNSKLDLFGNAQVYYKKYKKAKKSVKIVKERVDQTKHEISFLEQLLFDLEMVKDQDALDDLKDIARSEGILKAFTATKKKKNYKPYETIKIEGFDAYLGKNAKGNDIITFRLANRHDLWFHAKGKPSAHLVLKLPSKLKNVDDSVKIKAAEQVACRTKAQTGEKIDIDYAFVKDVKKPKNFKPGMVIYSNFKSIVVIKDGCS